METKTVMMPRELTTDHECMALLTGAFSEFYEYATVKCPDCEYGCNECGFIGSRVEKVPVSWTTIKAIYKKSVEHFGE